MSILDSREPTVPLPKDWPRLARSALVHAVAPAHFVVAHVRGWCADSPLRRVRLAAENERLRSEVAMLREEQRIKDARLARIPARNRPHYPPTERLAVLALKAARGWNLVQTAARFLVEPATIASWLARIDEEEPEGLVRMPAPVNRFPDFVRDIVGRIKATFPRLGTQRVANMLARAGLHVARTTVRRFLRETGLRRDREDRQHRDHRAVRADVEGRGAAADPRAPPPRRDARRPALLRRLVQRMEVPRGAGRRDAERSLPQKASGRRAASFRATSAASDAAWREAAREEGRRRAAGARSP
jgi:transposase